MYCPNAAKAAAVAPYATSSTTPADTIRDASPLGDAIPSGAPIQMNSSPPAGFECQKRPSHGPSATASATSGAMARSSRTGKRVASAPTPRPKNADISTRFEK